MHTTIRAYELKKDAESKFIYAVDKLEPIMKIYLDKGRNWKKHNITLEKMKENKGPKIAADHTVEMIYHELLKYLQAGEAELFPQE